MVWHLKGQYNNLGMFSSILLHACIAHPVIFFLIIIETHEQEKMICLDHFELLWFVVCR